MRIISTERSQVLAARVAEKLRAPVEQYFAGFPTGTVSEMRKLTMRPDHQQHVDNDMFLLAIDADRSMNTLVVPLPWVFPAG